MDLKVKQKKAVYTKRLRLAPYSDGDTEALCALLCDPVISKTFMVPEFATLKDAEPLAKKLVSFSRPEDEAHLEYGIYLGDRLIGFINDCGIEGDSIEIGYAIRPDLHGNGYATEAVSAVLAELRDMGFAKVTAGYFVGNEASRRVMEKCKMKLTDEEDEEEYCGEKHKCRYCEIVF